MTHISKEEIEHLAELSRIELNESQKAALGHDLGEILGYFDELKEVNTDSIAPKTGGALTTNEWRSDDPEIRLQADVVSSFPDKEGNLLKVPKVFEK